MLVYDTCQRRVNHPGRLARRRLHGRLRRLPECPPATWGASASPLLSLHTCKLVSPHSVRRKHSLPCPGELTFWWPWLPVWRLPPSHMLARSVKALCRSQVRRRSETRTSHLKISTALTLKHVHSPTPFPHCCRQARGLGAAGACAEGRRLHRRLYRRQRRRRRRCTCGGGRCSHHLPQSPHQLRQVEG